MRKSGSRIHIVQGECEVSDDPSVVITTLLGSCVSACLFDPVLRVGGMNHFLLPGEDGHQAERYGVHLMELLVNGLLKMGASRQGLQAKLFGGANTMPGLTDIGASNAKFARAFLMREGIACVGTSLGGTRGRRVKFWPATGRAMQLMVSPAEVEEIPQPRPVNPAGEIEFF